MQGPTNWQYAGQCAFLCEAPGDGTGGGENNLSLGGGDELKKPQIKDAGVPLNETEIAFLEGN